MPSDTEPTELRVGIFALVGLILAGVLLFQFGNFGKKGRDAYGVELVVRDATGVREGVPVRLGGVEIGYVGSDPEWSEDFAGIVLDLRIFEDFKIPADSTARVGTSGLMGDAFIRLTPPVETSGLFIEEGQRIPASGPKTMDDVATTAVETLETAATTLGEIADSVARLDEMLARLDGKVLQEENVANLAKTLENLAGASDRFDDATTRLGPLMDKTGKAADQVLAAADKADTAFTKVGESVEAFSETVATVDPAVEEFDATLEDLRNTLAGIDSLVNRIGYGDGAAAALLNDPALRRDLSDFVAKLEKNGILFYPRERGGDARGEERRAASATAGRPSPSSAAEDDKDKKGLFSWLKKKQ